MLAELAIANAAFKVIKSTLTNGREIADAGAALGKYFGAEKTIHRVKCIEYNAYNKSHILEGI